MRKGLRERLMPEGFPAGMGSRLGFLAADILVILASMVLAFVLRYDGTLPARLVPMVLWALLISVALKVPILLALRSYRFAWSYVGLEDLLNSAVACGIGSLGLAACLFLLRDWSVEAGFPRSILAIDFAFTLTGTSLIRLSKRIVRRALSRRPVGRPALVVGAGEAGELLVRALKREARSAFWPVGFVDDDPHKRGLRIHGVRVIGTRQHLPGFLQSLRVGAVIIAMPSAPSRVIRETVDLARRGGADEIRILPLLSELYTGRVTVSEVRAVQPEDVLPREPVHIESDAVERLLREKAVLVTGAAGSIGAELCRQVLRFSPARLVGLDFDETGLFDLSRDIASRFPEAVFEPAIGDIRDEARVRAIFEQVAPQIVFHAAAYKHVPMMETFPGEAVRTNVFGTRHVVRAACASGAEALVLISTDKAVNPVSVMGASKRLAESVILLAGADCTTRLMAVRFGNVLGSRGSVVPTFLEQIRRRGPVTVTDPRMRRYFMATSEAVLLVLQAGAMGKGGEVFVLDMGEPLRILDLAKDLIRFHGLEPDRDVPIVFTGVRPGEKLDEELLTAEEGTQKTAHEKILMARIGERIDVSQLEAGLARLAESVAASDDPRIVADLRALVPTYRPPGRSVGRDAGAGA